MKPGPASDAPPPAAEHIHRWSHSYQVMISDDAVIWLQQCLVDGCDAMRRHQGS